MSDLAAHAVLEGAGGDGEAEVVFHVAHTVGAAVVEILVGALGFDDEGRGLGAVELAVALGVADVEEEFGVALHVQVAAAEVGELHGALGPVAVHHAHRNVRADDEVLHMAGVDVGADLEETGFPRFAFPAVRGVGVDGEDLSLSQIFTSIRKSSAHMAAVPGWIS